MKRLNLKSVVAALTVAIAGIGLVLASIEKKVEETVTPEVQELHWYEKNQTTGEYSEVSSPEPPSGCPSTPTPNICAIGFETPQENVTDADAVGNPNVRYRP